MSRFGFGGNTSYDFNSDEEDESEVDSFENRTALLFIISASPEMFRPWDGNEEKPIVAALKVCEAVCRSKLVSSPRDKVGILFSHTEIANNSLNCDNLFVLQPLTEVTTGLVNELRKKIDKADLDGFDEKIGSSTDCSLANMFWLANMMFDDGGAKNMNKKIMYFTSEDNPHSGDSSLQQSALKKFKDLGKVDFSVITFRETFDRSKFYGEILEDESALVKSKDLNNLLKVVRMKQRVKRPTNRSTLELAPGVKIGVGMYSLVRKPPKPKTVPVNIRTNEAVTKSTTVVDQTTNLPVLKAEVKKVAEVAGEVAEFTALEVKDWRYNFEPGIFLIGFLDESKLNPFGWFRSEGYFLYPDEERITGSKELFTALLRRCDALKKIALVRFVKSRGQDPKYGCLIPSVEGSFRMGPILPQGFHLIILPFADEIRHHEVESREATPEMVRLMEKIVNALTQKDFNVMDLQNPELYYKWKDIESSALNLPKDHEQFLDYTKPNVPLMRKRAGDLSRELNETVASVAGGWECTVSGAGGKAQPKGRAPKLPKLAEQPFDMKMEWSNNRLERLQVSALKAFTDEKNIKVESSYKNTAKAHFFKKIDYVEAIKKYFENLDY